MKSSLLALLLSAGLVGCGPGNQPAPGGGSGKTAFLDQTKEIPAHKEWNREVTSRAGGTITFKVTAQGPFAVTVLTDKGYKAAQAKGTVDKADVLFTANAKEPNYSGQVTLPAGSSWFVIENRTGQPANLRLECFPP